MVKLIVFFGKMANGEIIIFFDLSTDLRSPVGEWREDFFFENGEWRI